MELTESLSVLGQANEVGSDGKLGGQAQVTNVSSTWKVGSNPVIVFS